jgi:anti-anti-sigma factor
MSTRETNYPVHIKSPSEAVLELSGDLTYRFAEQIEADFLNLICNGISSLYLDFSKVRYINSTGIALLIRLINLSRRNNVELKASGLSTHYQEIFKITRLGDSITVIS